MPDHGYPKDFIHSTVFDVEPRSWHEVSLVDEILDDLARAASGDDTKTRITKAIRRARQTWTPYRY